MWPGHPHVDPNKEATASSIRLEAGLTTLADECAAQGKDWEQQLRQRAREMELAAELGLEMLGAVVADAEEDEDDEEDIA